MEIEEYDLLIDEELKPPITEEEGKELKHIMDDFIESYVENKDHPTKTWLVPKLQKYLPEKGTGDINAIADEIIQSIEFNEEKKDSLHNAIKNGRSKESWIATEIKKALSAMSAQRSAKYLTDLDAALREANDALYRTITTQAGVVSQNPNLDGFIAEQYQAQSFNLNAEAKGSQYKAKVLEPNGTGYAKNSVDIVIVDSKGKTVRRYQAKYCKNAKATEKAFEQGNYRGQQKLVPEGQEGEITKKVSNVLEAPDGTKSNPLTKERAEELRDKAQNGEWQEIDWNEYAIKDIATGIGKQAGLAALQGAAIGTGFNIVQKIYKGEEIEAKEVVEDAIDSGMDFGIKAAVAGALKVGSEKEIIKIIPRGTPASTVSNIAYVGVEEVKILWKMAKKEITMREGLEKLEQTAASTIVGLATMGESAKIGTIIGAVFGPIGATIGGFVGGTVGYMAGSTVGEKIVDCANKICNGAKKVLKAAIAGTKKAVNKIKNYALITT